MATLIRQAPAGTITDPEQLQREVNVAIASAGSFCHTLAVFDGSPDDTLEFQFDDEANVAAVDAVIAAHPTYTPGLASSYESVSGVFTTVWRLPLIPGESAEVDIKATLRIGDGSSVESSTIYFDDMVRRRIGEGAKVESTGLGGQRQYGGLPQLRSRMIAVGNFVEFQISVRRTGTVAIEGRVEFESEVLA